MADKFWAMVVEERADGTFQRQIRQRSVDELPPGEVLIRVHYSSLNYKDALSATGHKGVTKKYPHTPGIDAAGIVEHSSNPQFSPGDQVLVTGYDLGMNTPGGFGQYVRVPAAWVVPLPSGLSLWESMAYGTAGFTAALSVFKITAAGVKATAGPVLVTGASGGVGSLAVAILAQVGYRVVAASGKQEQKQFLLDLGAEEVLSRDEVIDTTGKPLLEGRWAAVVDTVGGDILATALKAAKLGGVVTCCGNVASAKLETTVYPFILRGVSLFGIDSQHCPMDTRIQVWGKIAGDWKIRHLDKLSRTCSLDELEREIDLILQGSQRGRVVVELQR